MRRCLRLFTTSYVASSTARPLVGPAQNVVSDPNWNSKVEQDGTHPDGVGEMGNSVTLGTTANWRRERFRSIPGQQKR